MAAVRTVCCLLVCRPRAAASSRCCLSPVRLFPLQCRWPFCITPRCHGTCVHAPSVVIGLSFIPRVTGRHALVRCAGRDSRESTATVSVCVCVRVLTTHNTHTAQRGLPHVTPRPHSYLCVVWAVSLHQFASESSLLALAAVLSRTARSACAAAAAASPLMCFRLGGLPAVHSCRPFIHRHVQQLYSTGCLCAPNILTPPFYLLCIFVHFSAGLCDSQRPATSVFQATVLFATTPSPPEGASSPPTLLHWKSVFVSSQLHPLFACVQCRLRARMPTCCCGRYEQVG